MWVKPFSCHSEYVSVESLVVYYCGTVHCVHCANSVSSARLSAITCSHSVLRPQEEIERLRQKARAATSAVDGKQWPTGPSVNKEAAKALNNKEVNPFPSW